MDPASVVCVRRRGAILINVPVSELQRGDSVLARGGEYVRVECVVRFKRPVHSTLVHLADGPTLTGDHPVCVHGRWQLPRALAAEGFAEVVEGLDFVYNVLLCSVHVIVVEGYECATLGGGVCGYGRNNAFGTDQMVDAVNIASDCGFFFSVRVAHVCYLATGGVRLWNKATVKRKARCLEDAKRAATATEKAEQGRLEAAKRQRKQNQKRKRHERNQRENAAERLKESDARRHKASRVRKAREARFAADKAARAAGAPARAAARAAANAKDRSTTGSRLTF